jgi:hypothetical protein
MAYLSPSISDEAIRQQMLIADISDHYLGQWSSRDELQSVDMRDESAQIAGGAACRKQCSNLGNNAASAAAGCKGEAGASHARQDPQHLRCSIAL